MPLPKQSPAAQPDEPLFLSVIDLFIKAAVCHFAIFGIALAIDVVRGDQLVFRSWISFSLQSGVALLAGGIVARRTLAQWQQAGHPFVPADITSAAAVIGAALAAGTLLGGFFPDAVGYQRRAPEPFLRTLSALVPLAIAVYVVLRSAEKKNPTTPA